jgi:hypothetical protein
MPSVTVRLFPPWFLRRIVNATGDFRQPGVQEMRLGAQRADSRVGHSDRTEMSVLDLIREIELRGAAREGSVTAGPVKGRAMHAVVHALCH